MTDIHLVKKIGGSTSRFRENGGQSLGHLGVRVRSPPVRSPFDLHASNFTGLVEASCVFNSGFIPITLVLGVGEPQRGKFAFPA
jgi:hypothetical protein